MAYDGQNHVLMDVLSMAAPALRRNFDIEAAPLTKA
jgi:hypothetical protein